MSLVDADFGKISFFENVYDETRGIWQMHEGWQSGSDSERLSCVTIPGTVEGPYPEARTFLLQKRQQVPELWSHCAGVLEQFANAGRVCARLSRYGHSPARGRVNSSVGRL